MPSGHQVSDDRPCDNYVHSAVLDLTEHQRGLVKNLLQQGACHQFASLQTRITIHACLKGVV